MSATKIPTPWKIPKKVSRNYVFWDTSCGVNIEIKNGELFTDGAGTPSANAMDWMEQTIAEIRFEFDPDF